MESQSLSWVCYHMQMPTRLDNQEANVSSHLYSSLQIKHFGALSEKV